jgi:DNA (cytosine-5)-methyltransferase 1
MAGFRVLWANEFIPAAQDTYRVNFPDSILDERDIRLVLPEEILEAIGMKPGDLDLLDGSPPCQAFSTAGKREKGWGQARIYENGAQQCNETLFGEYVRILKGLQPKIFVAENVSGLVKGVAKGYFLEILAALKAAGYRVRAQVLDAQWLGVPQMRQRVIFIGVRQDLGLEPTFPKPLPYRYSVREALPWIDLKVRIIHDTSGLFSQGDVTDRPCPAITAERPANFRVETETDISRYAIGREWDKLKPGEQSDRYFQMVKAPLDGPCNAVTASGGGAGGKAGHIASIAAVCHPTEKRKFSIAELRRICAFPDDFILTGTYSQQWERLGNAVPPVMMRHIAEAVRDEVLIRSLRGLS